MKKSKDLVALNKAINLAKDVKVNNSDMRTLKEIDIVNWLMNCGKGITLKQANYIASSLFYGDLFLMYQKFNNKEQS